MSARGATLRRIDGALADLAVVQACLTAARTGEGRAVDRRELTRRFHAIAQASAGHRGLACVEELAGLAGKAAAASECQVVQHAADVLSLLLRDLGHQLLGCRGADVTPAATALRERLEHELLATSR